MYYCVRCGHAFSEAKAYFHRGEFYGLVCPECGCYEFEDAHECCYCESWRPDSEMISGLLCPWCYDQIIRNRTDIVKAFIDIDKDAFAEFVNEWMEKEYEEWKKQNERANKG